MRKRDPQLTLRLGSDTPAEHWRDGVTATYLGGRITVQLGTDHKQAGLDGAMLHLPLPPQASPRQIQDAAEAWLRRQAQQLIGAAIQRHAARLGIPTPRLALSFASKGGWISAEPACLRCNWHLIEQPASVIEQVIARAITQLPRPPLEDDLFAAFA